MKPFKTIDGQINILKDRGLVIDLKNVNELLFKDKIYEVYSFFGLDLSCSKLHICDYLDRFTM
ncbi:hypothetical protein HMPREF2800_07305 [Anaerosphaera sp. HMSC064C01]|nr:hypothetical protein HMPREF2800_07305 [Anaerosphaera sp. HMSC064C01]